MTGNKAGQGPLYLATGSSVYRIISPEAEPEKVFAAEAVHCVAAADELVVALDGGRMILLDGGERIVETGLDEPVESLLVLPDDPREVLIGTEGAHLYRLRGNAVQRIEAFDALDCRDRWHTPWGGPPAVRSIASTPDGWLYADIHVGSIMRSPDRGEHWEPVKPDLNEDVHQVATCPADANRVYANTAKAVFVSEDRGDSWEHRSGGLDDRYGRAIAVAPDDPDLLLATVSDGPHGDDVHGQLYRSEDAGRSWTHVREGFPASTRDNINTFHVALTPGGTGWAVVDDALYVGADRASAWREVRRLGEPIIMVAPARAASGPA
jgi:photosystem II stability/assembly factor-like uncharacterized protein